MRIEAVFSSYYNNAFQTGRIPGQTELPISTGLTGISGQDSVSPYKSSGYSGVIVDISPEGWEAYRQSRFNGITAEVQRESAVPNNSEPKSPGAILKSIYAGNGSIGDSGRIAGIMEPHECQTCKNRKYQDSSSDPSVSFQAPTHISPSMAAGSIAAHEGEHVSHEQQKAERDGRKVISQTVTLHTSICPECGLIYISGGVTRTITAKDNGDNIAAQNSEKSGEGI